MVKQQRPSSPRCPVFKPGPTSATTDIGPHQRLQAPHCPSPRAAPPQVLRLALHPAMQGRCSARQGFQDPGHSGWMLGLEVSVVPGFEGTPLLISLWAFPESTRHVPGTWEGARSRVLSEPANPQPPDTESQPKLFKCKGGAPEVPLGSLEAGSQAGLTVGAQRDFVPHTSSAVVPCFGQRARCPSA